MASTTERGLGREWQALTAQARTIFEPVCHICKQAIDLALPATHRLSWTLDHLDARAAYGTACPPIERTRPAHRACNSRKGDRPTIGTRWTL